MQSMTSELSDEEIEKLLEKYKIKSKLISNHKFNEKSNISNFIKILVRWNPDDDEEVEKMNLRSWSNTY